MNVTLFTYRGYKITVRDADTPTPSVAVFYGCDGLFETTSWSQAVQWVDAYIKGEQWAIDAKLGNN